VSSSTPDVSGLRRAEPGATPDPAAATGAGVPQPERRLLTRVGLPLGLVLAFALLLAYAGRDALTPRVDVRVVPAVAATGEAGARSSGTTKSVVAQAAGWVEPDPYPVYATALADGVVEEVLVLEGEVVAAGQVVARLVSDDAELVVARAEAALADAEARISLTQALLDEAQSEWDNPIERTRALDVAAAHVDEAVGEVRELDASVAVQDARIAELEDRLARQRSEVEAGASSEFAVTQSRLQIDTARAERERLLTHRVVLTARERAARAAHAAAQRDLDLRIPETRALAEAKAGLRRAVSDRDGAAAARDEAQLRLSRMNVVAPVDGVVMRRLAAPGAKLMLGMDGAFSAHVVHLYDPEKLQVRVDVPLADAAGVGVGQEAEVVVEVLPDQVFRGVVSRVVHEADIQKNTLQLKVAIIEPTPELIPEMLARVRFLGSSGKEGAANSAGSRVVFVPEELLLSRTGESAVVFVLDKGESTAIRREVKLGRGRRDGWVEIVSGVTPGDSVIDGLGAELDDGRGVRVVAVGETR
jgi:RND family efflux transporter MFP subunit